MMRIKIVSCILSMSLALSGIATAQDSRAAAIQKIDSELFTKMATLEKDQTQRVMVQFDVPATLADAMRSGAPDLNRVAAVAEARSMMVASLTTEAELRTEIQGNIKRSLTYLPYVAVDVTGAQLDALSKSSRVVRIYEDKKMVTFLPESTALSIVDAATTRAMGYEGQGQTVAILDGGVAKNHTFIGASRVVAEACYSTSGCPVPATGPGTGEPEPGTVVHHGMHVAGIAAGSNTLTFSGVAPQADIISVRVVDKNGGATSIPAFLSDLAAGLNFVYGERNNFDIAAVNLSLGVPGIQYTTSCDSVDTAVVDAINLLDGAGIAVIAASGNDSSTTGISFPACASSVISVGSTGDGSGSIASCRAGVTLPATSVDQVSPFSNSSTILDLLAPGANINSSHGLSSGTCNLRGTSMAAPHVTGAFAVLKSAVPYATKQDVLDALIATGKPVTDTKAPSITKPRIDVYEALLHLQANTSRPFAVVPLNGFSLIPTSGQ